MTDQDLKEKASYFQQQDLLDLSDDETGFPDAGLLAAERALVDTKAMPPPPTLAHQRSFLGPTPRERQQEFETHPSKKARHSLSQRRTAPEPTERSIPATQPEKAPPSPGRVRPRKLKKTASMSEFAMNDEKQFYKRMGAIPRELKNKNAKLADNINMEPESKQVLRGQLVYFYPNNDTSSVRRIQIHKIIQLGAAWVKIWRDDVSIVIVDEDQTCCQLLRHLNRTGFPVSTQCLNFGIALTLVKSKTIVVKYDPFIPESISYGAMRDHTAPRFLVKNAPRPN